VITLHFLIAFLIQFLKTLLKPITGLLNGFGTITVVSIYTGKLNVFVHKMQYTGIMRENRHIKIKFYCKN